MGREGSTIMGGWGLGADVEVREEEMFVLLWRLGVGSVWEYWLFLGWRGKRL